MKRYLLQTFLLIAACSAAMAQPRMKLMFTDGTAYSFLTSEISQVIWEMPDDITENDPTKTVVTGDATNVTCCSVTLGGFANNIEGDPESTFLGIIYCSAGIPTINNGYPAIVNLQDIGEDGSFEVNLRDLSSNTVYHYRVVYMMGDKITYGDVKAFRTKESITFQKCEVQNVTCYSAEVAVEFTMDEGVNPQGVRYGVMYGESEQDMKTYDLTSSNEVTGSYTTGITGLKGGTTYYCRPVVRANGEMIEGETVTFTTAPDNLCQTGDMDGNWVVGCTITLEGVDYSTLEMGVCYSRNTNQPTVSDNVAKAPEGSIPVFFSVGIPINRCATWYYRAYVIIDGVAHYGEVKEVVVDSIPVKVGNAVDLGLSVLWADMNVGAEKPGDRGWCLAWGETEEKDTYDLDTYKWYNGSEYTKYCFEPDEWHSSPCTSPDHKATLDPEDDAASVKWGGNWRMPTADEMKELCDKCEWQSDSKRNWTVTGPNGNSIIIPAGCFKYDGSAADFIDYPLTGLWTSSVDSKLCESAVSFIEYVNWRDWYFHGVYSNYRRVGFAVRPVCPK